MKTNKLESGIFVSQNFSAGNMSKIRHVSTAIDAQPHNQVAFQGLGSNFSKRGWYFLRHLSETMKSVSEITNAVIAAIGTGIIAPLIIMVSPGKGDKEDKDKKFFQAIRQPLSAGLALGFQVPMTMIIERGIYKAAYEKQWNFFKDDILGSPIPSRKYIKQKITKEELANWVGKFEDTSKGTSLKQELEEQIRKGYEEVGLEVSNEKIAKKVEKQKIDFLKEKITAQKYNSFIQDKVDSLLNKSIKIEDIDLVTDEYKQLAIQKNKAEYEAIAKSVKIPWYEKFANLTVGFSSKNIKKQQAKLDSFAQEKGLELLKQDDIKAFESQRDRLLKYVENKNKASQKILGNKIFWLSLAVNLVMVTLSCHALNWAHPRLGELIDKLKGKNAGPQQEQKVEVA